ncbi:beta-ketoacyl synthase N-terminal-like domain-containing protein [Streptomyces sp. NPDC026294]|uniref:type I polyketide synthase n=1 Tax=Streptomyces sp. NPDC026294 TaxID=3155362 RepID=UPI0033EA4DA4
MCARPTDRHAPVPSGPLSASDLTGRLLRRAGELLDVPAASVGPDAALSSLGLTSLHAVALSEALAEWSGRPVPPSVFWEAPTLAGVVDRVLGHGRPGERQEPSGSVPSADREPVAIVGIGCRLPGASTPEQLWELLLDGRTTADGLELHTCEGARARLEGSFLDDVDSFDAAFFAISPREAATMDPQQRLLLETAWEALEDAGQVPAALAGSATGVFVGISGYDHGRLHFGTPDADLHIGTGSALSIAANRLSYAFHFTGPSLAVDTACSSSLVAVHLACRSLWEGESELALAAGVNVILDGAVSDAFARAGFLSPDGRCKTFDAAADGYGRGEGCAVVVLKPLTRALADGDPVYAVVKSTAVNQDGHSNGLTAPSGTAQERLLAAAYRRAGVAPGAVGYIEAHGTGTPLGDPVEARAIGRALGGARESGEPLYVGSVKSNLGHLEAAAGIAGLVKAALCVRHRTIPPTAGYRTPNPGIDFAGLGLRVPDRALAWPGGQDEAVAGVSSFGFGGTNAHIVLGEPPATATAYDGDDTETGRTGATLLPVSGTDPAGATQQAVAYRELLASDRSRTGALAYTAGTRRTHHRFRRALVAGGAREAGDLLAGVAAEPPDRPVPPGGPGPTAFVFSGQGNQWPGMGRELLRDEPVAAAVLGECDDILEKLTGWSLLERLAADEEAAAGYDDPAVLQPVLVSVQLAVARLLESWGIAPEYHVGHSLGEVSAAAAAGALSTEEALFLAVTRGEVMRGATGTGSTALLGLPADEVGARIAAAGGAVDTAAWNAPRSTLVAGDGPAVERLVRQAAADGVFARVLPGTTAFHSRFVEPLHDRLAAEVGDLAPQDVASTLVSTVTGGPVDGSALGAAYWARNLREPVRFAQAVRHVTDAGCRTFVEIGAHPTLTPAILETAAAAGADVVVAPTLRRGEPARTALLHTAATLYEAGAELDFAAVNPASAGVLRLPVRQWNRQRFGDRARLAARMSRVVSPAPAGLLGRRFSAAAGDAHYWDGALAPHTPQLPACQAGRYGLAGVPLHLPDSLAAAALDAAEELFPERRFTVDVRPDPTAVRVAQDAATQLALTPDGAGGRLTLHTRGEGEGKWLPYAEATLAEGHPAPQEPVDVAALLGRLPERTHGEALRAGLVAAGWSLPEPERAEEVQHGPEGALVRLRAAAAWNRRAMLDSAVLAAVLAAHLADQGAVARVPARLAGVSVPKATGPKATAPGATDPGATDQAVPSWARVTVLDGQADDASEELALRVQLLDAEGWVLGGIGRITLTPLGDAESAAAAALLHQDEALLAVADAPIGELLAASPAERPGLLTDYLRKETARVLRMPAASIDPAAPMNALGLDSIMSLELHRRLEAALGIEVPVVRFLRGATTTDIAAELAASLADGSQGPADGAGTPRHAELEDPADIERLLAELDDLPEEEVDSLLQRLAPQAAEQS